MQEKGSGMVYPTPAVCAKDDQDEHGLEGATTWKGEGSQVRSTDGHHRPPKEPVLLVAALRAKYLLISPGTID